jgi:hypothetical protein
MFNFFSQDRSRNRWLQAMLSFLFILTLSLVSLSISHPTNAETSGRANTIVSEAQFEQRFTALLESMQKKLPDVTMSSVSRPQSSSRGLIAPSADMPDRELLPLPLNPPTPGSIVPVLDDATMRQLGVPQPAKPDQSLNLYTTNSASARIVKTKDTEHEANLSTSYSGLYGSMLGNIWGGQVASRVGGINYSSNPHTRYRARYSIATLDNTVSLLKQCHYTWCKSLDLFYPWVSVSQTSSDLAQNISSQTISIPVLNGLGGSTGQWNQFAGQPPYPIDVNSSLDDALYAGTLIPQSESPLVEQVLLGYDPQAETKTGNYLESNLQSLYQPWGTHTPWIANETSFATWGITTTQQEQLPEYEQRYREIGKRELNTFYTNQQLSILRIEAMKVVLFTKYVDPLYIYYNQKLQNLLSTIYTTRPSYETLYNLALEISSWTDMPQDNDTLEEHYNKRLSYKYYEAVVQYEVLLYLLQNPETYDWIVQANVFLSQRLQQIQSIQLIVDWQSDWYNRWSDQQSAALNEANIQDDLAELRSSNPTFAEYIELNQQATELLSQFDEHPSVQQMGELHTQVITDETVSQKVETYYNQYSYHIGRLLDATGFKSELERHSSQIIQIVSNDPIYHSLKEMHNLQITAFQNYEQQVHDAVLKCYETQEDQCNPYEDPDVIALVENENTVNLIHAAALFYEADRLYWHQFYNSSEYQEIEDETENRMRGTLKPVSDYINQARGRFAVNVHSIPLVKEYRQSALDMINTIRGRSVAGLSNATMQKYTLASEQLDQVLTQMVGLSAELDPVPVFPSEPEGTTYNGSFINTTYNIGGDIEIRINIETDTVSGYMDTSNAPDDPVVCGAGDFEGIREGNDLVWQFISSDFDEGCGFDVGFVFEVDAALSGDESTITGTYRLHDIVEEEEFQEGTFEVIRTQNENPPDDAPQQYSIYLPLTKR